MEAGKASAKWSDWRVLGDVSGGGPVAFGGQGWIGVPWGGATVDATSLRLVCMRMFLGDVVFPRFCEPWA